MLHPQARALQVKAPGPAGDRLERQIHGFITMGRVLDEANVAVSLCASQLRRALAPA